MDIDRIDHVVMTVQNLERTCAFYESVLGFEVVTFGPGRKALKFGLQKLNLHEHGKEFEPKASAPAPGAIDICFISETPIESIMQELTQKNIAIEEGPVQRSGAVGSLVSVYLRDPDGNLLEISNYVCADVLTKAIAQDFRPASCPKK